ncbi:MAG: hypothetical protein LBL28_06830 [Treponema sp.]|jgi:hypothetical protein|nr:hypothetical protein [Treponema sp.]
MNGKIRPLKRAGLPLLLPLLLAAGALVFSRCELYGQVGGDDTNIEGALPHLLQGEWAYIPPGSDLASEVYIITGETISYGYAGGDNMGTDFTGNIRFVSNYSAGSGLIIIEYTVKPTYSEYNDKDYFALYYRNLHTGWVQLANSTILPPPAKTSPEVDSLDEAKTKFTRMTIGKYVDWSAVMPQRRIR